MSSQIYRIANVKPTSEGGTVWKEKEVALSIASQRNTVVSSTPEPATGIVFRENDGSYDYDFHQAPREQYVVSLSGSVEITTTDGVTKTMKGGEPMYVEDVVGKGHKSKAGSSETRRSIFVCTKPLDPKLLEHGKTTYLADYGESKTGRYFPLTRVVATEDGGSKFMDVMIPLDLRPIESNFMSVVFPAYDVVFAERTGDSDFHTAPRKHLIIILSGTLEIQTTDGAVRQFNVGNVLQNEDTTGKGHQTRAIGGPVLSMWMKTAEAKASM